MIFSLLNHTRDDSMTPRTFAVDQVLLWSYLVFLFFYSLRMIARPEAGFTVVNLYRIRFSIHSLLSQLLIEPKLAWHASHWRPGRSKEVKVRILVPVNL